MSEYKMTASMRRNKSKGYKKSLIERGYIPAVAYGKTMGNLSLEVDARDVQNALKTGKNTIINLTVTNNGGPYKVMIKDLQYDPIKRDIMHVDFQQVSLRQKVHTAVPLKLTGAPAFGMVNQTLWELEISCLPGNIPEQINVDINGMKPGDSFLVSQVQVPEGITVLTEQHISIAQVIELHEEQAAGPLPEDEVPPPPDDEEPS